MVKNIFKLDWVLNGAVFLLLSLGLAALYSISTVANESDFGHFHRQIIAIGIGFVMFFTFSFFDYRAFNSSSTRLYLGALAVLVVVLIFGSNVRGTTGWLGFGGMSVQPVEMVKIVMIIFFASFLSKKKTEFGSFSKMIISAVMMAIPVLLVIKQPDFGSAIIIVAVWLGMLVVSGLDRKSIFALVLVGVVSLSAGWFMLKDYQKERLLNFANPARDAQGTGYNVIQSTVAVGAGEIWGKGLGHGSQSQLNFLPEKHTDFIFAVIAEELGFFGSSLILALFGTILFRSRAAARRARDNFGFLLVCGVMIMLFAQIFINIGMNIGVAPVTGVPLPLLSYGGSSMISVLAALGLVQSVYLRRMQGG